MRSLMKQGHNNHIFSYLTKFQSQEKSFFRKSNKSLPRIVLASSLSILAPTLTQAATINISPSQINPVQESTASQITFDVVVDNPGYGGPCTIEADIQPFLVFGGEAPNATLDTDYTFTPQTVSIPISDFTGGSQTVTVDILDDTLVEPAEYIGLELANPRVVNDQAIIAACTAQLGEVSTITTSINDDPPSQSNLTMDIVPPLASTVIEDQDGDSAQLDFQVALNNPDMGGPCTITADIQQILSGGEVNDATQGDDFTLSSSTVTFNITDPLGDPNPPSQIISINVLDDQIEEPTEVLGLQLTNFQVTSNQGEAQCNVTPGTTTSFNVDISDGLATASDTIALDGAPGETVTDSFIVTGGWDVLTASNDNNQGSVDVVRLDQPTPAWQVSYSFTIPAGAPVGGTLQDQIAVTGDFDVPTESLIRPMANPTTIPVTINIISGLAAKPSSASNAWQQLCETTQNPELIEQCQKTDIGDGNYQPNSQQIQDLLPEEYAAMGTGSIDMAQGQIKTILYQQQARRQGLKGIDLKRLTMTLDGQLIPVGQLMNSYLDQATGGGAGDSKAGRWSGFISGRVNTGKKDATENDSGYDFDTAGLTAGVDYLFNPQAFIGGALGYAAMDSNFGNSGGDLDISAATFTFYGSYFSEQNLYFDLSASYGQNKYDFTRNLTSFSTQTQGSTDGSQFLLSINGGWDFYQKSLLLSPYLRLDYIDTTIDAYEETGGSGLALQIDEQSVESTTTALGGRFSYSASMSWGVLMPTAHLEWVHEFNDDNREIVASFANNPSTSFSTPVDETDQDYFNLGLGLSANWPQGRVLFLNYETVAEQQNFSNHTLHLGGRMEF